MDPPTVHQPLLLQFRTRAKAFGKVVDSFRISSVLPHIPKGSLNSPTGSETLLSQKSIIVGYSDIYCDKLMLLLIKNRVAGV